jgi:hypothetical protein
MRTPHLRTNLSAEEVAQTLTEALHEISKLSVKCEEQASEIARLNGCIGMVIDRRYTKQQAEIAALNEQILNQARTIEAYQKKADKS